MQQESRALLILLTIPVLWGITFPLIHLIVVSYSPTLFVLWRFLVAAVLLLPVFLNSLLRRKVSWLDIRYGLIIGVVNSGAFVLQAMALQTVDSSRTAFLSAMNVVIVPLLLPFFALGRTKLVELLAALVCLAGIYLISQANFSNFSYGDLFAVASAFCIALGIIITEKASLVSNNLKLLTFYQIIFTCLVPVAVLHTAILQLPHGHLFWWGVAYCALMATAIPLFLQLKYQKIVGSSKVAIIFSMEALTATFCAWLMGENITLNIMLGGGLIVFSALISYLWKLLFAKNPPQRII